MNPDRLQNVRSRLESACKQACRQPSEVSLLAVGKRHPATSVKALFELGQIAFGENQLQEALKKQLELADTAIEWHFIGQIQSNKTAEIASHFDWVQSVDREKILNRLSSQRPASLAPLNICLQVNVDRESQKAGLMPEEVRKLAASAVDRPGICLRGLMCIPRLTDDPRRTLESFRKMRQIYRDLQAGGFSVDTLSMGMSADLELAIMEGSTMVRIGTDLFGPRPSAIGGG